jgi:hypothetical protein
MVLVIASFEARSYKESLMVAANIYLLVGLQIGAWQVEEIERSFAQKSSYLFDQQQPFNRIFKQFVAQFLEVSLEELLPYIQYSARCYWLELHAEKASGPAPQPRVDWARIQKQFLELRSLPHTFDASLEKRARTRDSGFTSEH